MNHPADLAYFRQLDSDIADEARFDEAATTIYNQLTVTGGADDARAAECINFAKLRHAFLLLQKGARDEALEAFAAEFTRAANECAELEAPRLMRIQDAERAEYMEDR